MQLMRRSLLLSANFRLQYGWKKAGKLKSWIKQTSPSAFLIVILSGKKKESRTLLSHAPPSLWIPAPTPSDPTTPPRTHPATHVISLDMPLKVAQ